MLSLISRLLFVVLVLVQPVYGADLTLNLKGADLTTLIETVAQATGHNFILDPQIKGKVTVISAKPMTEKELYKMFLAILEVYGYIAVPTEGGVIKIIPSTEIKYSGAVKGNEPSDGSEAVTRVFKLKHVNAARLMGALRPMASPKAHMASYDDGNMLIVSDHADVTERLAQIVQRVDVHDEGEVEVITLENAAASEVARVINSLEQGQVPAGQPPGQPVKPPAVADDRTNSIMLGGDKSTRLRLRTIITHLDTPVEISGNTRVVSLRYASAKKMVDVLGSMGQDYLKNAQKDKKPEVGIVNVQAYEGTNALVITAPPALLKSMQDVIRRLDVRQAQVQVEAIIVEVSVKKAAELGMQWGVLGGKGENRGVVSGTNFPNANPSLISLGGALARGVTDTAAASLMTSASGLILAGTNGDNFAALLRALNSDHSNNVLSTPTVVTLDNEEAEILVGSKISVSTGQTNTIQGGNPFTTFSRENVGLTLKVKPQISEGDVVRMEIMQEVSNANEQPDHFGNRDTNNRTIKTSVLVDDQQILALGGLITNDREQSNQQVPILGDLPLIGALFRAESASGEKRNLMVFLRPTILRTKEDGILLTHEKYKWIREQQLSAPKGRGPVVLEGETPLLPEIGEFLHLDRKRVLARPTEVRGETLDQHPVANAKKPVKSPILRQLKNSSSFKISSLNTSLFDGTKAAYGH
ncbi:MAG: type II secretion system secretin GspD [Magnetococcales bacterium]|nr:type II secretion system secretin GspD [Magnetococcales bacterium]MBF0437628.1 type II secretion system secretin GspD [Magnetococcales bacterium]